MNRRSLGPNPYMYPQPALLVGCYDANGKPDIMTAAWGGICCSEPVCLQVSIRPARHSHGAILARKAFTISIPSETLVLETDYAGIVSGRRYDKFAVSGLTPARAGKVDAPYVDQCPVVLECRLLRHLDLGAHTMMIGEILDVTVREECFPSGAAAPDAALVKPLIFDAAGGRYYGLGPEIAKAFSVGKGLLPSHGDE